MGQGETSVNRAMRLLALVRDRTEHTPEPVFVADLASPGGLSISEAEAAWRYLQENSLIDTFSLPYTARINARGIDRLETGMTALPLASQKVDTSVDPLDRSNPPAISDELHTVLVNLWRTSLATQGPVDAPTYREAHRGWDSYLTDLAEQRCIARDGDQYRLTPLGLLVLRDAKADEVIRLGDRVRLLLAVRYRDRRTRREAIGVTALARELGEQRSRICSLHYRKLTDALNFWCAQFSTDLSAESAAFTPGERVLDGTSVAEVARQLERWAASARANDLATRSLFREPPTILATTGPFLEQQGRLPIVGSNG